MPTSIGGHFLSGAPKKKQYEQKRKDNGQPSQGKQSA